MYTMATWTGKTWTALAVVVGALCLGPLCVAHGQSVSSADGPPAEFVRAWQDAIGSSPTARSEALAALRVNHPWEPHFRANLNRVTNQELRDRLRPALVECQSRLFAWNLTRAKDWEKEFRFDMLTCLAAATDDNDQARAVGDHVLAASDRLFKERYVPLAPFFGRPPPPAHSFMRGQGFLLKDLSRLEGFRRLSGDYVRVPASQDRTPVFIHGRNGEIAARFAHHWLCLTNRQLKETADDGIRWNYSVICVNGDFAAYDLGKCLVICDGDLTLSSRDSGVPGHCNETAMVGNGDVTAAHDFEINSFSVIYAAGDFVGPKEAWRASISVFAGGTHSSLPPPGMGAGTMKAGVKENPFGVKFVSPSDAGVELDIGDKVVRLGKLAATSPLVKAGLEKGDRVVTLNGVPMETAKDFRRQLRESLVWGTGLFEVRRGDQTFLRLVKFAEPPKK